MTEETDRPRVTVEKTSEEPLYKGLARGKHEMYVDEGESPPPIGSGEDRYPSPVDNMCWALGSCQAAVLAQALAKARVEEFEIAVSVDPARDESEDVPEEVPENLQRRIRELEVTVDLDVPEEYETRARRCLEVYDEGCIVGQSFKAGIDYDPETSFGTY